LIYCSTRAPRPDAASGGHHDDIIAQEVAADGRLRQWHGRIGGFSGDPAQKFIFIADLQNGTVWQLDRQSGEIVGHISHKGPNPGEFFRAHVAALDSKSNVYVGEIGDGSRVQKLTPN
jgi:hypothetical protein